MSSSAPKTVQRTPFKRWCDENTGLFFLIPWILALPAAVPLCHGVAAMALVSSSHELWLHLRGTGDSKGE